VIEAEIKLTLSLAACARKAQAGHKYEFATCEIKKVTHPMQISHLMRIYEPHQQVHLKWPVAWNNKESWNEARSQWIYAVGAMGRPHADWQKGQMSRYAGQSQAKQITFFKHTREMIKLAHASTSTRFTKNITKALSLMVCAGLIFYASHGNDKKGKPLSSPWKVKLLNLSNKKEEKNFQ
jgi:hypothetical protein